MVEFVDESGTTGPPVKRGRHETDVNLDDLSPHHTLGRQQKMASPGPHQHLVVQQQTSVPLFADRTITSLQELLDLLEEYGLDSSGYEATDAPIHMRRSKANDLTVTTGTLTKVPFGQQDESLGGIVYDAGGLFDWEVPVDSIYLIQSQVQWEKAATTVSVRLTIRVNGTTLRTAERADSPNIDGVLPVAAVKFLEAGDLVTFHVFHNLGSNLKILGDVDRTAASITAIPGIAGSSGGGGGGGGVTDHGALTGLADDDHPQYLTQAEADALYAVLGSGVTDHGALSGLADDDHPQYLTAAEGNALYSLLAHTHAYLAAGGATQVDVFTSSGTWNKPTGCVSVDVVCIGGGGGGASGAANNSTTTRSGGAGAGGAAVVKTSLRASDLSSSETVTVGDGGVGGVFRTTASPGFVGNEGNPSSFGSRVLAAGGFPGNGGSTGNTTPGGPSVGGQGGQGGGGNNGVGIGANVNTVTRGPMTFGGGAGGGATSGVSNAGGDGGSPIGSTPATAGAIASAGNTPSARIAGEGGWGGSGGGSSSTGTGGNGATGGLYGGGGGGGGAGTSGGFQSGAGGNGGKGVVLVVSHF